MDNGKDLGASPVGPWMTTNNAAVSSFPIIQHYPKMTSHNFASGTFASGKNPMPQSGSMLPLQYDSLLSMVDRSRQSSREPFHALAPLFRFVAFSEVQFLNLMEGQIDDELAPLRPESRRVASLDNLHYLMVILDRHIRQLRHGIRAVLAHSSTIWCWPTDQPRWPTDQFVDQQVDLLANKGLFINGSI